MNAERYNVYLRNGDPMTLRALVLELSRLGVLKDLLEEACSLYGLQLVVDDEANMRMLALSGASDVELAVCAHVVVDFGAGDDKTIADCKQRYFNDTVYVPPQNYLLKDD